MPYDSTSTAQDTTEPNTSTKSGARKFMDTSNMPDVRATFSHIFLVSVELALLSVQFFRMEALAFDVLPELADLDFGFMYGSHLMGIIWLLVVVLLSYVGWELAIRLYSQGSAASGALKLTTIGIWIINFAAMAFEFVLFRMLVDDFNGIGFAGVAELFGLLMVAAHQIASFWIMKNVVRSLYLSDEPEQTQAQNHNHEQTN